jgi:formate-dependent nitrite reductase cytochrome c552 subunit
LKASEKPSFCASCHVIKPYYQSWENGELLAAKHGTKDVKCLDCHKQSLPGKMKEGFVYVTGTYETPLKEREFSKKDCLKCHEQEKIVAATNFTSSHSNPHDSHLGEMDCNLCHKMHRKSEVYCAQCHDFDWFKKLDSGWKVQTQ